MKSTPLRFALTLLVAMATIFGMNQVASGSDRDGRFEKRITVLHGPTDASNSQSTDLGAPGHSVGDLLTVAIPFTAGKQSGTLVGSLMTVAVDKPSVGQDIRTSQLTFVFGDNANQIVIGGQAVYEISQPTLSIGVVTVRPVLGGSGKYSGARGYVESTRLADNTWKHVLHITTK
jgi:hypothetical protein